MPEGGTVAMTLMPVGQKRELVIISDDAGRLALGAGLFMNGSGGSLLLTAELNGYEEIDYVEGELVIENFRLVKSSVLVAALVVQQGREVDDMLDDNGLTFRRFNLPFRFSNGIVDISEARANGPAIGFTLEGQADFHAEEILEISDNGSNDWMVENDPDNPGYKLNGEHLQRSKLRVDTRKWIASKFKPNTYADKIKQELSNPDGSNISFQFIPVSNKD